MPESSIGEVGTIDVMDPRVQLSRGSALVLIRRRWRLIAAIAVAGSMATFTLCKMLTPLYSSRVTVLIDPGAPQRTATSIDPMSFLPPSEESVRKNEIAIIRSRGLAERVISELHLDQTPEFNPRLRPPSLLRDLVKRAKTVLTDVMTWMGWQPRLPSRPASEKDEATDIFASRLDATATDASRVVDIRFSSQDPKLAYEVADAVAASFVWDRGEQENARAKLATHSLEAEITQLNKKIHDTERYIDRMKSEHGVLPAADFSIISQQMSDLGRQLVAASAERAAAESKVQEVDAAIGEGHFASLSYVLNSVLIQRLQELLATMTANVDSMAAMDGEKYYKVVQGRKALASLYIDINTEIEKIATSYRSDLAIAKAKEGRLLAMIADDKLELAKASASEVDVRALEREADASKSLLTQLVGRLNDTRAQMSRSGPGARVISAATIPRFPSFPPTLPIVAVSYIFFTTGGVILAALLESRDRSIRSTSQIREMTALRIFGTTPAFWATSRSLRLLKAPSASRNSSMFIENLRRIWLQIDHARHGQVKTIQISSAVPGEGKSSTATALARLLALDGVRVAIVDADLRYPTVHKLFGLHPSPGLSEVIESSLSLAEVMQPDPGSGATVIAAGTSKGLPAHILSSPRMAEILTSLAVQFDAVIIDTPPLLPLPDAAILARKVDMTLMVVRWGSTKATTFASALQQLRDLNVAVGGVVMTMVDQKRYYLGDYPDSDIFSPAVRKYHPI